MSESRRNFLLAKAKSLPIILRNTAVRKSSRPSSTPPLSRLRIPFSSSCMWVIATIIVFIYLASTFFLYSKILISTRHGSSSRSVEQFTTPKSSSSFFPKTSTNDTRSINTTPEPLLPSPPLLDFFSHIPKTGGEYAFYTIGKILNSFTAYENMKPYQNVTRLCNQGTQREVSKFFQYYVKKRRRQNKSPGLKCQFHMAEADYRSINSANKTYTVLRDPVSHTLSMYYHCAESPAHSKRTKFLPPTLNEWLQLWANASQFKKEMIGIVDERILPLYRSTRTLKFRTRIRDPVFKCYNPLDFQSYWTDFHNKSKEQLKEQFVVLGDQAQMEKTVCVMFLEYTQGQWGIPQECDCTEPNTRPYDISKDATRSQLDLSFHPKKHAHGVQHHGSSANITDEQRNLILHYIRSMDVSLYKLGQEIFQEQVTAMERKHNIQICDKFRIGG